MRAMRNRLGTWRGCALLLSAVTALGAAQTPPMQPDIPEKFTVPEAGFDYSKREVMIPMRDGVKLHTVIVIPEGAKGAPIILTRTPYDASHRARASVSPHMLATLPPGDAVFVGEVGLGGEIRAVSQIERRIVRDRRRPGKS